MGLKDHLEKLIYFYAIAKTGTMKEAATHLKITQPSLTKSIHILEEAIGKPLFDRLPRGVSLTKVGAQLFSYCHSLFADLENIEAKLNFLEDPMAGSIRVGTYDSIAIYFWPQFLRIFLNKYPKLELELTTQRSATIQKMVENCELDLGLIINPYPNSKLTLIKLARDSFQLYQAVDKKKRIDGNASASLIYMPDALAGEHLARLDHLISSEFPENLRTKHYRTSSLESVKELTNQGIGIGLLPKYVAQNGIVNKQIQQIFLDGFPKSGIGQHTIGLVYRKDKKDSKILMELVSQIAAYSW